MTIERSLSLLFCLLSCLYSRLFSLLSPLISHLASLSSLHSLSCLPSLSYLPSLSSLLFCGVLCVLWLSYIASLLPVKDTTRTLTKVIIPGLILLSTVIISTSLLASLFSLPPSLVSIHSSIISHISLLILLSLVPPLYTPSSLYSLLT